MAKLLSKQIEKLKTGILELGAIVEERVHLAVQALMSLDSGLAEKIVRDDEEINHREVDLEEECLKVLALYQPVAIDLRFIIAILKINNDLERIGDLAVSIAQRTRFLAQQPERIAPPTNLPLMADKTQSMLKRSLDSLVHLDSPAARGVLECDKEVDAIRHEINRLMYEAMRRNPARLECYIQVLLAASHLERIADHATNIAEDVIYLAAGEIVRHGAP